MADVEVREKVEVLDPVVGLMVWKMRCSIDFVSLSVTGPISKCTCPFSLHLSMHLWLCDGLVARDYDHISVLLK